MLKTGLKCLSELTRFVFCYLKSNVCGNKPRAGKGRNRYLFDHLRYGKIRFIMTNHPRAPVLRSVSESSRMSAFQARFYLGGGGSSRGVPYLPQNFELSGRLALQLLVEWVRRAASAYLPDAAF